MAIAFPLLRPLGLPLDIGRDAQVTFDLIEALKPGDTVLFPVEFVSSSIPELMPQGKILMAHLMMRPGVKVVAVSFNDQGHVFADRIMKASVPSDKVYGEDYINLGYIAGGEGALAGFLKDIRSVLKADYTGGSLDSYPIMKGINSVTDFALVVGAIASSGVGETSWVRQMGSLDIPFAFGTNSAAYGSSIGFVQAGQLEALLAGGRGAAEYEKLVGIAGAATTSMDAQSIGQLFIVGLILLGNVSHFVNKGKDRKENS